MSKDTVITVDPDLPVVEIAREFDATPHQLFRALTEPELVKQWLSHDGTEMTIDTFEAHSGGSYRYVHNSADGGEHAFRGSFHTVRPDELIIQTFEFEGVPDTVAIETARLEDLGDGRTRLSQRSVYPDLESRNGIVEAGMATGVIEAMDKLQKIAAGL